MMFCKVSLTLCTQQDTHADDLPATYGTSSAAEPMGQAPVEPSAPPAPQQQQHDPLAPPAASSEGSQQPSWQHYPDPSPSNSGGGTIPSAASPVSHPHQQQGPSSNSHYPSVPTAADYPISLGSARSGGSMGGGMSPQASTAATLGSLATAISTMPASNPELRITVLNPLRHMGPSGIPGTELIPIYSTNALCILSRVGFPPLEITNHSSCCECMASSAFASFSVGLWLKLVAL
jgi:hypothetical protein